MSLSLSPDAATSVATLPRPVLIATRDAALGRMIAMALRLQGYSPHQYTDGQQALDELLVEPYTAAVLDMHLPTVDGLTICERARASAVKAASVPIILVLMQEDKAVWQTHKQRLRVNTALFIPFQLRDLISAVAAAIEDESPQP